MLPRPPRRGELEPTPMRDQSRNTGFATFLAIGALPHGVQHVLLRLHELRRPPEAQGGRLLRLLSYGTMPWPPVQAARSALVPIQEVGIQAE